MRSQDWMLIGVGVVVLYWIWQRQAVLPSAPIAPGSVGPAGGLMLLPPGLPSQSALINTALGLDANGNPLADAVLASSPIGFGYVDLAPAVTSSSGFDGGLTDPTVDGFAAVLPSTTTVPLYSTLS